MLIESMIAKDCGNLCCTQPFAILYNNQRESGERLHMRLMNCCLDLTFCALVSICLQCVTTTPCSSEDASDGARLYQKNCEVCHHIGENIIRPDKTLDKSAKLKTTAIFKRFLSRRNGLMPPYLTLTRNDKDLQALYAYIKTLNSQQQPSTSSAQTRPAESR